ncbi:MAG TPA: hypothetical protein VF736_18970 [Pyrinomonadaceae bacterium]|jgi:hypothetical protein
MSKTATFFYLLAAVAVLFGGAALGGRMGLPQVAAVGVGLLPALLLAFPLVRRLYRDRLSFPVWALVVAAMSAVAMLLGAVVR